MIPRRLTAKIARFWTRSIRRQLMLGMILVYAVLMSLFVFGMVERQRAFLHRQGVEQAQGLVNTLAANSTSWVLSDDVVGLGEIIQSLHRYPDLRYAMVLSPDGRVLAHVDPARIGLYVQDDVSRSLLGTNPMPRTLISNRTLIDVAAPVMAGNRLVGWARIGLGQQTTASNLDTVTREGILYTLAAIVVGLVFAALVAKRVTGRLSKLVEVAAHTRLGRRDLRASVQGHDEIANLADGFNLMLDAVAASEDRIRLLLDSTAEGIYGVDTQDRCTFCNPAALKLLGHTDLAGLLGQSVHQLIHHSYPDGTPYPREHCRALIPLDSGEGVYVEDEVFWRSDGSPLPVEYWSRPIFHGQDIIGVVVAFTDITERRKNAERMENQLRFTQTLIDTIPNPVYYKDDQLRYLGCNRAFEAFVGKPRETIVGTTVATIAPPDLARHYEEKDKALLRAGGIQTYEEEVAHADGSRHDMVFYKGVFSHADTGNPCIVGVMLDVTARKNAEEQLKLTAKVFESSREAILITDASHRIISVNRAFSDITGYSAEDVVGHETRQFRPTGQGDDFYEQAWQAVDLNGYWRGEVWSKRKNGELFPAWLSINTVSDEEGRARHYVSIFSDISERKEADERIRYLAQHDALTGLPNRALLHDRLSQAISGAQRAHGQVAVLFLDIDHFKNINDSLGHPIGDRLLQEVGKRLTGGVRGNDTVSRQGGDEFVVVLGQVKGAADAAHFAQKIMTSISEPYNLDGIELSVTPSVGISLYPDDGKDIEILVKNADAAMYHAKESGRNNYQFYTRDMNARAFERLALENSLRRALERNEFLLHYQPQLDLSSGRIIGAEALVRWQHPDLGLVSPEKFIPVAEESGLIVPVGEWVLKEACRQNRAWQEAGVAVVPIAVNLSALQFRQKNFEESIADTLSETGLAPELLELELTESIIMQHAEDTIKTVQRLKASGLRLSVDDFGTGYSSLSYLKRFPIDKLKIDKTFVRDLPGDADDAAITRAIISLAHNLHLKVIAEGVESAAQMDFLKQEACDEIQGYHFSRPLPAKDFASLLAGESQATQGE